MTCEVSERVPERTGENITSNWLVRVLLRRHVSSICKRDSSKLHEVWQCVLPWPLAMCVLSEHTN